jgi:hypothetical protein
MASMNFESRRRADGSRKYTTRPHSDEGGQGTWAATPDPTDEDELLGELVVPPFGAKPGFGSTASDSRSTTAGTTGVGASVASVVETEVVI